MRRGLEPSQDTCGAEKKRTGADGEDDFLPASCWGVVERVDELHFFAVAAGEGEDEAGVAAWDDEDVEGVDSGGLGELVVLVSGICCS